MEVKPGLHVPPRPAAKAVLAVLCRSPGPPQELARRLGEVLGPVDYRGPALAFDTTDYYRQEFGDDLVRCFFSFRGLFHPGELAGLKQAAHGLETGWTVSGRRKYNLDPGYLDVDKLVLASFKRGPLKLYIGRGVYADILLKYGKGRFEPMPWAFADFKDARYHASLLVIREKLKAELRKAHARGAS